MIDQSSGERVIFIDDEEEVRLSTTQTLELEGFEVTALASAEVALKHISQSWPGVVVTDVKMPRLDGFSLLNKIIEIDPDLPVVLVTAHGDIPMAIRAIRDGAYDFVEKIADPEYLVEVIRRAIEKRRLVPENRNLRREMDSFGEMERRIFGKTPVMESLRRTVADLADTNVDVLIVGETGTGKELVARCLHEFGARRNKPFVAVNCGALPESIIESELFGHEAGAFTGANSQRIGKIEYAEGGTLFLDEISSMPHALQVRLLRVLQERTIERLGSNTLIPVDIRVVAASKIDLLQASKEGAFRADLYYRLNVANVSLPPLRTRLGDVPLLFQHFLQAASVRYKRPMPEASPEMIQEMLRHAWPGNVRELKNVADRLVLGMPSKLTANGQIEPPEVASKTLADRMAWFERETIADALREHAGRVSETADALGVPRKTLYLRMQKYGLKREDFC